MSAQDLIDTVKQLMAEGKGLLAMDESNTTCNNRFEKVGVPSIEDFRRAYREMILTTPNLGKFISGAILFDETIRQSKSDGTPFLKIMKETGIIPGIKVDKHAVDMAFHPGEKITEGLDGLRQRFEEYAQMGARFSKWRAVITIGEGIPTRGCIEANANALARYAALSLEAGIVPIVEPEVLIDGDHSMTRCFEVTQEVLHSVFNQLNIQKIVLEETILKPSMVLPGIKCQRQESVEEVADATVTCLLRTVPAATGGVAFLSGGQPYDLAAARLNAMHTRFESRLPWPLTFSYSRAIQQPALETWKGHYENSAMAQQILYHRAKCCSAARQGKYTAAMERQIEQLVTSG